MKTLELNAYGVSEMKIAEMQNVDGGWGGINRHIAKKTTLHISFCYFLLVYK